MILWSVCKRLCILGMTVTLAEGLSLDIWCELPWMTYLKLRLNTGNRQTSGFNLKKIFFNEFENLARLQLVNVVEGLI